MKKVLNVALIGGGFMGKAHANAWRKVNTFFDAPFKAHLKVVAGEASAPLEAFAANWEIDEVSYDWKEVVARKDIDIVDIVTPTFLHAEMAIAAAQNGKHVLCEKPCALTYAQCAEMAAAAKKAGVVSYLNHNYRRVPAIAYARQLIDEGRIGEVLQWNGTYFQDWLLSPDTPMGWQMSAHTSGGGALYDLGSHAVDLVRFLVGEPTGVTSVQRTYTTQRRIPGQDGAMGAVDVDDAAFLLLEFGGRAMASVEVSRVAAGCKNNNSFELYGTKGALRFDFLRMNELQFYDNTLPAGERGYRTILAMEDTHPYMKNWWPCGHVIGFEHTFVNAFNDVLEAIAGKRALTPNFEDGAKILRILQASQKSSAEGRRVAVEEIF